MDEKQLINAVERSRLVLRYLGNDLNVHEQILLQEWVNADPANRQLFDELTEHEGRANALAEFDTYDVQAAVERLDQKISKLIEERAVLQEGEGALQERSAAGREAQTIRMPLRRLWLASAAAVAAIALGLWLYDSGILNRRAGEGRNPGSAQYASDIAPGKNTATLSLADGKTINLSDAKTGVIIDASKLTYNDGTAITSSLRGRTEASRSKAKLLTVSTPRAGQYQVVLSDGTKVWLNADSKISFPSKFSVQERRVFLIGEAYFEVVHDETRPFRVETSIQEVDVLGTHFNINSYADEASTKTTLLEGSVSVSSLRGRESASRGNLPGRGPSTTPGEATILKPGQQSVLSGSNRIEVQQADLESAIAWKNGEFLFKEDTFPEAMRKIARWYDVEVVYDPAAPVDFKLGGFVSRSKNISSVLKLIELTGKVHFRIEGRRVFVKPGE